MTNRTDSGTEIDSRRHRERDREGRDRQKRTGADRQRDRDNDRQRRAQDISPYTCVMLFVILSIHFIHTARPYLNSDKFRANKQRKRSDHSCLDANVISLNSGGRG